MVRYSASSVYFKDRMPPLCSRSTDVYKRQELGIRSWLFNITGIVMADSPRLILTLEEGKPFSEETSSGRRRRKGTDTVPRVFSIMPSMRGFEKNLAGLAEQWTDELVQAFGSKKLYEQYEKVLGWGKLRERCV